MCFLFKEKIKPPTEKQSTEKDNMHKNTAIKQRMIERNQKRLHVREDRECRRKILRRVEVKVVKSGNTKARVIKS